MRGSARKMQGKSRKLLQLYSLWQETRSEKVQRQFLGLLGTILAKQPNFNVRPIFQTAF